eukprot:3666462-Lingulodinium_polyedra.AAC.1
MHWGLHIIQCAKADLLPGDVRLMEKSVLEGVVLDSQILDVCRRLHKHFHSAMLPGIKASIASELK